MTVLDGFYYELDDTGNITRTEHEDGSYWEYEYDDRYRAGSNIHARCART